MWQALPRCSELHRHTDCEHTPLPAQLTPESLAGHELGETDVEGDTLMLEVSDMDADDDFDIEPVLDSDCDAVMLVDVLLDDGDDEAPTLLETELDNDVEPLDDADCDSEREMEGDKLTLGVSEGDEDTDVDVDADGQVD